MMVMNSSTMIEELWSPTISRNDVLLPAEGPMDVEMSDATTQTEEWLRVDIQSTLNQPKVPCSAGLEESTVPLAHSATQTTNTVESIRSKDAHSGPPTSALFAMRGREPNFKCGHTRAYSEGDQFSYVPDGLVKPDGTLEQSSVTGTCHQDIWSRQPVSVLSRRNEPRASVVDDAKQHRCEWRQQVESMQIKLRAQRKQVRRHFNTV